MPPTSPDPSADAPVAHPLQGTWEGDGDAGPCSLTVEGDRLFFHARPDFQYEATFTLVPDSDPAEFHATIVEGPRTTDSAGERVVAIYSLEGNALRLAAVDKPDGEPGSFDRAMARYQLERTGPRD